MNRKYREEKDTMGVVQVPENAYYGAQTQRAADNFSISGLTFPPSFIKALSMIKKHAAQVNQISRFSCQIDLISHLAIG